MPAAIAVRKSSARQLGSDTPVSDNSNYLRLRTRIIFKIFPSRIWGKIHRPNIKIDVDVPERTPDSVPPAIDLVFIQAPIVYVSIGSEDPRSA